jgi:hypothetical protein
VLALYPFLGVPADPGWPRRDFADVLVEQGKQFFELADLPDADAAVFPQDWKHAVQRPGGREQGQAFLDRAAAAGVPAVFFWASDATDPFPLAGAVVLRPSLFRSGRRANDFALPGFHEDLLEYVGGSLPVREKGSRATVGFCGYAPEPPRAASARMRLRRVAGDVKRSVAVRRGLPVPEDVFVRRRAIDGLLNQDAVDTNIVLRDDYGGSAVFPHLDVDLWMKRRAEYVQNIVDSDYVLCTRGNGNYSYRLYEALSLGRIPVFVDTDCVLPYDFEIDWPSYGVWLDRTCVNDVGERVATFHAKLGDGDFVDLQRRCRQLWEEFLSPAGFFSKFHLHFARLQRSGGAAARG